MLSWFLSMLGVGRFYSLEKEVKSLKALLERREAEKAAIQKEAALLKEIQEFREKLGIV